MTDKKCKKIATKNRKLHDSYGDKARFIDFPENCQCTSQHLFPQSWEKYYSVERPK
jgi:hypothetical protein